MRTLFAALSRNMISLTGAALTTASAALILTLFALEIIGTAGSPYIGILTFVVLPSIFVVGLVLIPAGIWLGRLRARRTPRRDEPPAPLPVIDLNVDRTRKGALLFLALTSANLVILGFASYKGVEVMDSTRFCGQTCHSVMTPELTTYRRSPHSRVPCVSCHIGPGAGWFVKSKLSGSWQLLAVTFNLYPRPIPTPVENLRPARETCEECHWPEKFVGDRLKVITHHSDDEANTPVKTVLLLRVGGGPEGTSRGIHWHVDPAIRIRYRSDRSRQTISEVELTRADGTVQLFSSGAPGSGPEHASDSRAWRTMDCVDCHNRPTHIYRTAEEEIDRALESGAIDRGLPFLRREGLAALRGEYRSQAEARERIAARIRGFYASFPSLDPSTSTAIETAARALGEIYAMNVYPSMNITWGTYPSHLGHRDSPGCFRCHDGAHTTSDGRTIDQDCSTCHALLAMEEESPEILKQLQP